MGKYFKLISTIVTALSVLVVLFLILFSDSLLAEDTSNNIIDSSLKNVKITFDTDPLVMDKTNLDLMAGVNAVDERGENVIDLVNASVINDTEGKVIMYSINRSEYKLESFKREVELKNYVEPFITVKNEKFKCDINDLHSYIRVLIAGGKIKADDGFGNDISPDIYIDPSKEYKTPGTYQIRLMVKNSFADFAQKDISINLTGEVEKAKITLSPQTATIKKDTYFSPDRYILSAIDNDGNDVMDKVIYENNVDLTKEGIYKVYYYIEGEENGNEPAATLTVVVTE